MASIPLTVSRPCDPGGSMLWASSLNSSSCTSVHLYSLKSWERRSATSWVVITCSVIIIVGFDLKKDEKVSTISRDLELKNYEAGKLRDERRKLLAISLDFYNSSIFSVGRCTNS